ncbi:MAG: hypothetical protein ABSG92_06980 [Conexivisphaerales archaeon]
MSNRFDPEGDPWHPIRYFRRQEELEAARELGNEENSDWITEQLKKALDPKDRDTVEF